jgi:hypothetical protein
LKVSGSRIIISQWLGLLYLQQRKRSQNTKLKLLQHLAVRLSPTKYVY